MYVSGLDKLPYLTAFPALRSSSTYRPVVSNHISTCPRDHMGICGGERYWKKLLHRKRGGWQCEAISYEVVLPDPKLSALSIARLQLGISLAPGCSASRGCRRCMLRWPFHGCAAMFSTRYGRGEVRRSHVEILTYIHWEFVLQLLMVVVREREGFCNVNV